MSYDDRYRRSRRPLYAPPSRQHHSALGYWVPLVLASTLAIGGIAAWIWKERLEHEEEDYQLDKPPPGQGGSYPPPHGQSAPPYLQGQAPPGQAPSGPPPPSVQPFQGPPPLGGESTSYYADAQSQQSRGADGEHNEQTFTGWAQGMVRRTPSPQQFFDTASRHISAGAAAVGAAAGAALSSITEEGDERSNSSRQRREKEEGFSDHERWSEEADEKSSRVVAESSDSRGAVARHEESFNAAVRSGDKGKGRPTRKIAVVVSAEGDVSGQEHEDVIYRTEHASILSHLPSHHDPDATDLFVLIYAPDLKSLPQPPSQTPGAPPSTLGSSNSTISTPAQTPGSDMQSISPRIEPSDGTSKMFDALYQQALTLVSSPTQILPFTTPSGYVHILRHLAPQLVYLTDSLSLTEEGKTVEQLNGWVGQTILVVGDEGHGGLADTETEDEEPGGAPRLSNWYEHSNLVGLGKGVEIVDAARVGEDWSRRVGGRE